MFGNVFSEICRVIGTELFVHFLSQKLTIRSFTSKNSVETWIYENYDNILL